MVDRICGSPEKRWRHMDCRDANPAPLDDHSLDVELEVVAAVGH